MRFGRERKSQKQVEVALKGIKDDESVLVILDDLWLPEQCNYALQ